MKMKRKNPITKGGDRGLTFPAEPDSSGAVPHKGYHTTAKEKGGKRELVSLLDAEGPNVPFKVFFVLFLPGKNDFPFRLLVGKVE